MLRVFFVIIFLCSCSANKSLVHEDIDLDAKLFRDFNIVRDKSIQSYLSTLKNRLFEDFENKPKVYLAKHDSIFAFSFKSGSILISTALILACRNEAELSFVIAHEYAHLVLDHFTENRVDLSNQDLQQREIQADSKALQIVFESGFSIQSALDSILRFELHDDGLQPKSSQTMINSSYPSKEARIENLRSIISKQLCTGYDNCLSYGTSDSRAFQANKSNIMQSY